MPLTVRVSVVTRSAAWHKTRRHCWRNHGTQ